MHALPHYYTVKADTTTDSDVKLSSHSLPILNSAPPTQFGGPGDQWSPEDLLMASVADCFVLSFKAIARMSKLNWHSVSCESEGELDKVDGKTQFTKIKNNVHVLIEEGESLEKAEKIVHKSEAACLVTNSLRADVELAIKVVHN